MRAAAGLCFDSPFRRRAAIRYWRKDVYLSAVHRFLGESPAVDVPIVTQESKE